MSKNKENVMFCLSLERNIIISWHLNKICETDESHSAMFYYCLNGDNVERLIFEITVISFTC